MWKRILFLPNIWVMQRSWFLHRRYCEKSLRAWVPRNEHEISDLNIQDDLHEICRRNYLLQVKVANSAHPGGYDWWSWPRNSWFSSDISGYTCSHYEERQTNSGRICHSNTYRLWHWPDHAVTLSHEPDAPLYYILRNWQLGQCFQPEPDPRSSPSRGGPESVLFFVLGLRDRGEAVASSVTAQ